MASLRFDWNFRLDDRNGIVVLVASKIDYLLLHCHRLWPILGDLSMDMTDSASFAILWSCCSGCSVGRIDGFFACGMDGRSLMELGLYGNIV
jgi:hypothetical protein